MNFDAKNVKKKNGRSFVYIEKVFLLILLKSLCFDAEKQFKTKLLHSKVSIPGVHSQFHILGFLFLVFKFSCTKDNVVAMNCTMQPLFISCYLLFSMYCLLLRKQK